MGMMGQFYHLARGVPEDKIEALAWYLLAAEQSDETAVPRTNLLRELTPAQQAYARTRAEVLRSSIKRRSYLD